MILVLRRAWLAGSAYTWLLALELLNSVQPSAAASKSVQTSRGFTQPGSLHLLCSQHSLMSVALWVMADPKNAFRLLLVSVWFYANPKHMSVISCLYKSQIRNLCVWDCATHIPPLYFLVSVEGRGKLDGVGFGSCLEFQKGKSDDKENNISTFAIHKNILEGYTRNCCLQRRQENWRDYLLYYKYILFCSI